MEEIERIASDNMQIGINHNENHELEINEKLSKREEIYLDPAGISNQQLNMGNWVEFQFTCDCCGDNYENFITLFKHRKSNNFSNSDNFKATSFQKPCFCCPLLLDCFFSNNSYFRIQKRLMTIKPFPNQFKCDLCPKTYGERNGLKFHQQVHTGEKLYKCNICNKKLSKPIYLKYHQYTHLEHKEHECNICNKKYSSPYSLKKHFKSSHAKRQNGPFKCDFCDMIYWRKEAFDYHIKYHTGESEECDICNKKFVNPYYFKKHYNLHNKLECKLCHKKFAKEHILKLHMTTEHSGNATYDCHLCTKKFIVKDSLIIHVKKHKYSYAPAQKIIVDNVKHTSPIKELNENKFKCDKCSKMYEEEISFKYHKCDTVRNVFKCDLCPKTYARKRTLEFHQYIHTGEKPYSCNLCDKKFTSPEYLKSHQYTHLEKKQFNCNICNRRYSSPTALRMHSQYHVKEKSEQFKCSFCCKSYLQKHSLQKHMKKHSEKITGLI